MPTDRFHCPVRNIMSSLDISSRITDGLLAVKETGKKLHLEIVKTESIPIIQVSLKQLERVL